MSLPPSHSTSTSASQSTTSPRLTSTTLPRSICDALIAASHSFEMTKKEIEDIDATPIQKHVEALSSLPPSLVYSKISTLERWALTMGFEEAACMKRGRELDVFGIPDANTTVGNILHHVVVNSSSPSAIASTNPSLAVSSNSSLGAGSSELSHLETQLESMYGHSNHALLAALQQLTQESCHSASPTQTNELNHSNTKNSMSTAISSIDGDGGAPATG